MPHAQSGFALTFLFLDLAVGRNQASVKGLHDAPANRNRMNETGGSMPISISPALVVCMVAGTATWSTHVLAQSEGGTDSSEPRTMQSAQAGMFLPYSIAPAPTASGRSRSCSA